MKVLSFIKNHKVISSVAVLGIVICAGAITVLALSANKTNVSEVKKTSTSNVAKLEEVKAKSEEPVESVEAPDTPVVQEVTPTPAPVQETPKPIIKSTQEYGSMYLDLTSSPILQECFDIIVARWPARFAESVREKNVKALRAFASTCSTGVKYGSSDIINKYGANGEFFDSELADKFND